MKFMHVIKSYKKSAGEGEEGLCFGVLGYLTQVVRYMPYCCE